MVSLKLGKGDCIGPLTPFRCVIGDPSSNHFEKPSSVRSVANYRNKVGKPFHFRLVLVRHARESKFFEKFFKVGVSYLRVVSYTDPTIGV